MSSPFDVTDENILARECVADCRRRSWHTLSCIIGYVSMLFLWDKIHATGSAVFVGFLAIGLLTASVCFAALVIISGATYLLKYRSTKQGMFSIISGTAFGIMWLMLLLFSFLAPAIASGGRSQEISRRMRDVSDIKQAGLVLYAYANENNGKYPDDLVNFLKTELPKIYPPDELKQIKRVFYKKDGVQLRWILTPGLTTGDDSRTILLQAADRDKHGGLVCFTIGNSAEYLKFPDKYMGTVNGKPKSHAP